MAEINLQAADKDGKLSGSGTIKFKLPPDATFAVSADLTNKTSTITLDASDALQISHEGFEFSGSIADDLKSGAFTGKVSLTYKPSDNVVVSMGHTFDEDGGATSLNVSIKI